MPVLHKIQESKHGFHAKASRQSCSRISWVTWRENWAWFNTANMGKRFHRKRTTCVMVLYSPWQQDPYVSTDTAWQDPWRRRSWLCWNHWQLPHELKEWKHGQWCCDLLALERKVEGSCWWGMTPWEKQEMSPRCLQVPKSCVWFEMVYQMTKLG